MEALGAKGKEKKGLLITSTLAYTNPEPNVGGANIASCRTFKQQYIKKQAVQTQNAIPTSLIIIVITDTNDTITALPNSHSSNS